MDHDWNKTTQALQGLRKRSSDMSEFMKQTAESLSNSGALTTDKLANDLSEFCEEFKALYSEVYGSDVDLTSLADQVSLEVISTGLEQQKQCAQADAVIEKIVGMKHSDKDDFPALTKCQENATQLLAETMVAPGKELSENVQAIVNGKHDLCTLARMIFDADNLSDDEWGDAQDQITQSYGRELATAVVRGKIMGANA